MKIFLILLATAALARAGTSASADYSSTTDVLDAGGKKATSASYTNDGSIGAIGRFTTIGAYSSRGGFPGQLYELTNSLQVNLSPATIGETQTLQLGVQHIANDATLLTLTPSSVTWSNTGPLSISTVGAATAGAVYQDTAATATATLGAASGSLALTVLDTLEDNFGIYANDGITDDWQISRFGVNAPTGLATADPDEDAQNNLFEFLAETDPKDPESRFRLRIQSVPGKPDWKALIFSPFSTERVYRVEWTSLFDEWFDLGANHEGDLGAERFIVDEEAVEPVKVYRIEISR